MDANGRATLIEMAFEGRESNAGRTIEEMA
jgi:hypothetical protein